MNVTVYTPSFNRRSWLKDCIESVASQDYAHKRHLIVDDKSTDDTFEYVCSLMKNAENRPAPEGAEKLVLGYYKNSKLAVARLLNNSGPSEARNWAMKSSWHYTDVFGNLDSDDRYRPGYLSKLMEPFKHNEIGVVYCDYEVINHDSQTIVREFKEPFSRKRILEDCLLCNNSLIRKTVLEAVGGYDATLRVAEDWDLWLRVAQKALIYHVPECLLELHAGQHGSSVTVSPAEWAMCRRKIAEKMMG